VNDLVINPHVPAEERVLSNVGHKVEGAIMAVAGVARFQAALTEDDQRDRSFARLLMGAGSLLGLALVGGSFHHGGPRTFFRNDHQQRQHLEMAGLIAAAGAARCAGRPGAVISNALIGRVGQMFLTHEQHGTSEAAAAARAKHERLGWTIAAAAVTGALGDLTTARALRFATATLMVVAALQLLTYEEPEGAFETH
jgi:hypothetical protein